MQPIAVGVPRRCQGCGIRSCGYGEGMILVFESVEEKHIVIVVLMPPELCKLGATETQA